MRFQIICSLLCLSLTSPAMADGMRYTTLGAKRGQLNPPQLTLKSLDLGAEAQKRKDAESADATQQKTFEDVWQHYRALAEGRAADNPGDEKTSEEGLPVKSITPKHINLQTSVTASGSSAPSGLENQEPPAGTPAGAAGGLTEYRETPLPDHIVSRPMGIIDQYEQSKARRSQMKTLRIARPESQNYGLPQTPQARPPEQPAAPEVHHLQMRPPKMKPAQSSASGQEG